MNREQVHSTEGDVCVRNGMAKEDSGVVACYRPPGESRPLSEMCDLSIDIKDNRLGIFKRLVNIER